MPTRFCSYDLQPGHAIDAPGQAAMDAGKARLGKDSAAAPDDGPLVGLHDINARRGPGGQRRQRPEPEVRPPARPCGRAVRMVVVVM